jgi:predicted HicB family RNase H-like nuclease
MSKQMQTFKLDPELISKLKTMAIKERRSFNNYVETALYHHVKKSPLPLKK